MQNKVPIYQEVKIKDDSGPEITKSISRIQKFECPIILNLLTLKEGQTLNYLEKLKEALGFGDKVAMLPYPTYILSEHKIKVDPFLLFKNYSQLPHFYSNENKRLSSRELTLLKNINISIDKIKNLGIKNKFKEYKEYLKLNKELDDYIKENNFYEKIYKGLKYNE